MSENLTSVPDLSVVTIPCGKLGQEKTFSNPVRLACDEVMSPVKARAFESYL